MPRTDQSQRGERSRQYFGGKTLQVCDTSLNDVKLVRPKAFGDDRGWFAEVFSSRSFKEAGLPEAFVQDNQSYSRRGVLRGLHYQVIEPQGKLVRALSGHIWDVAVDLRPGSPQFGQWAGFDLSGDKLEFLWIPEGFGHGFVVLSETANVLYKTTRFYTPAGERCVRWDDPTLNIAWPIEAIGTPAVSAKDAVGALLGEAELPAPYVAS
jgi:dTDP-4-dehydrorhamnose 3,5-epimerase